jgi:hypothetical protein
VIDWKMKNDHDFDESGLELCEDVEIELDTEPNMEYVLRSRNGFACELRLNSVPTELLLDAFSQGVFHSVLQVDPYQVKRCEQSKKILHLKRDVNECVCIIAFAAQEDIQAVYALAIKQGVKAFISKSLPEMNVSVPVFLVPTSTLEKLSVVSDELVNIQQKPKVHAKVDGEAGTENENVSDSAGVDGSVSLPINLINTAGSYHLTEENVGDIEMNYQVC